MDCPYIIRVGPSTEEIAGGQAIYTARHHIRWLKDNQIDRYRWDWKDLSDTDISPWDATKISKWHRANRGSSCQVMLRFRFESEEDKVVFALKWA